MSVLGVIIGLPEAEVGFPLRLPLLQPRIAMTTAIQAQDAQSMHSRARELDVELRSCVQVEPRSHSSATAAEGRGGGGRGEGGIAVSIESDGQLTATRGRRLGSRRRSGRLHYGPLFLHPTDQSCP